MQMLQGLSGLSQAQGGLSNPLLYYTYYTQVLPLPALIPHHITTSPPQMVAAMQAQQQKLVDSPQQVNNNHLPMVKDLLSPLRQGPVHRVKHDQVGQKSFQNLITYCMMIPCKLLHKVRQTSLQMTFFRHRGGCLIENMISNAHGSYLLCEIRIYMYNLVCFQF